MARAKKGGLGKGLDALFMDNETVDSGGVVTLRLSQIEPNRDQPRKIFSEEALNELADSIREHGVLQPLLVRPLPGGSYQLVAGERRWRASRMAGLQEVPVVIREMDEEQAMEIALIENLQREDLNAIEEATGYKQLMERYGMTQEQVAKRVGKSRPAIANACACSTCRRRSWIWWVKGRFPPDMRARCWPLTIRIGLWRSHRRSKPANIRCAISSEWPKIRTRRRKKPQRPRKNQPGAARAPS